MRNVLRAFLAAAAIAATALTGSASVAAASSDNLPAFTERYNFDEAWCFDQGDWTDCTVSHNDLVVTYTPNTRATARIHVRAVTNSFDNVTGEQIARTRTTALDKMVFEDGFQSKVFTVQHTRYSGPLGDCNVTYKLSIVEYELKVDKYLGPGCE
jgi:hypothetical protein